MALKDCGRQEQGWRNAEQTAMHPQTASGKTGEEEWIPQHNTLHSGAKSVCKIQQHIQSKILRSILIVSEKCVFLQNGKCFYPFTGLGKSLHEGMTTVTKSEDLLYKFCGMYFNKNCLNF